MIRGHPATIRTAAVQTCARAPVKANISRGARRFKTCNYARNYAISVVVVSSCGKLTETARLPGGVALFSRCRDFS